MSESASRNAPPLPVTPTHESDGLTLSPLSDEGQALMRQVGQSLVEDEPGHLIAIRLDHTVFRWLQSLTFFRLK